MISVLTMRSSGRAEQRVMPPHGPGGAAEDAADWVGGAAEDAGEVAVEVLEDLWPF